MNKRLFLGLIFLTTVFSVFAASYTSPNQGILRIANEGELPSGMFIKAQGYLPGDSINVNNELNGSSAELLNLGSYAGDDCLLIVTKQVALCLGLSENEKYEVKLAVRHGNSDSSASGLVLITKNLDDDSRTESVDLKLEESNTIGEDEDFVTFIDTDYEVTENIISNNSIPVLREEPSYDEEQYYDEENYNVVASKSFFTDTEYEQESESSKEICLSEPVEVEVNVDVEHIIEEKNEKIVDESVDLEEPILNEAIAVDYEIYTEDDIVLSEEVIADFDMSIDNEVYVSYIDDLEDKKQLDNNCNEVEAVTYTEDISKSIEETEVNEIAVIEENIEYTPIVLVPAAAKIPDVVESGEEEVSLVKKDDIYTESSNISDGYNKDFSSYVVNKESSLVRGCYYIQIATLKNDENVNNLLTKYNKYPIILIPTNTNKGYKVLIGPLTVDEYGAVFEKFKSFGFKDSFVKKIK